MKRAQVQFLAPTPRLTTVYNSRSMGSNVLCGTRYAHGIYIEHLKKKFDVDLWHTCAHTLTHTQRVGDCSSLGQDCRGEGRQTETEKLSAV